MNTEVDRKIAVILIADVVGYSKHMERDENATLKAYAECEKLLKACLKKYKGSIFNTAGDSALAEFPSAVNAVECGVAFQNDIKKRNESDKTEVKLAFRIGINMGDVVKKEGNLFGDGVNIAARLEALAQPNGISISKSVYDLVVPKTKMTFNDLGVQKVKQSEFHAFDILLNPSQKRTLKTKSKPMIPVIGALAVALSVMVVGIIYFTGQHTGSQKANLVQEQSREKVLGKTILISPFQNKSGLKEFDAIADGISDHLISSLSPTTLLKVLPRKQSQFAKEQNFTLDEIQSNLGASFVLDGGITTSNEKFRVTIEMIDIKEDEVIWSSTQEFKVSNLFEAQDRLEFIVRRAIQANLTMGENLSKYIASSFSNSVDYKKILSLRVDNVKNSLKITNDYVEAYKKVHENNPNNSLALTLYAQAMYHQLFSIGLPFKDYAVADEAITKAIKIDTKNSLAYPLMAQIKRNMMGDVSLDFEEITRKGLELDPENYETIIQVAHNLVFIRTSSCKTFFAKDIL
jgi:adenylate cyclase